MCQITNPVTWECSAKRINKTTYEVILTATIDTLYPIYNQTTSKQVSFPTGVSWNENKSVILTGNLQEIGNLKTNYEKIIDATLAYYERQVAFVQTLKVKAKLPVILSGRINYTACN